MKTASSDQSARTRRDPRTRGSGRLWNRLHPETLVCSWRGHVAPAADVARLRAEDAGLGVDVADGRRFARCLRCDGWVATPPPAAPGADFLPPLAELALPRRARALRDAIVIRLIAVDRAVHAVVFGLLAAGLVFVRLDFLPLRAQARGLLDSLGGVVADTAQNPSRDFLVGQLNRFLHLHRGTLTVLAATAVAYCVVEGVEAVGLWRERRWAEYLTALATAGFLPFEVRELAARVTVVRIGALAVNLAILAWLVWSKRLFGIRGGARAAEAGEPIDREALFGPPSPPE